MRIPSCFHSLFFLLLSAFRAITLCTTFFFFSSSFSQTPKQWTKLGDGAEADGDFFGAALYYRKALSIDSANIELLFKYAGSLRKSNDYELAGYYYRKVYNGDVSSSGGGGKTSPPQPGSERGDCLFWLATMQKFNGDYVEAGMNFKQFEKTYKDKSSYFIKKAKKEVKSCAFAKKIIQDSVPVIIRNTGESLNSFGSELSAILLNDSTMYFSSLRPEEITPDNEVRGGNYLMKIFTATKEGEQWKAGAALDTMVNNASFHNGNGTFSKDKRRFYFSRCDKNFKCAIYMSELKDGLWQPAVKLENKINLDNYSSTQPMLAEMGKDEILFFVSDMPGGKGKLDIWSVNISDISRGKTSTRPMNLSQINTPDNDISPFFDSQESILYFSSEWYYGLGGQDIFKTRYNKRKKEYSSPVNMGCPYNSSVNDMYFSIYPETKNGFFTSNRKGSYTRAGETCCNDIYEFEVPGDEKEDTLAAEEKKYISLEMLNKYLPVTLFFHNDEPNPRSRDTITLLNYLKTCEDYFAMFDTYKDEYSQGLKGENKEKARTDIEDFFSDFVEKGISDLELFSELLLKELENGQKIELTIKGYASPLAKTDYNVNLTLRRISSLQNYLREAMDGEFIPYLDKTAENGGWLEIVKIPFGEYKADVTVSDNLNDQRNSVYNRKAALERKIEIMSVSHANADSLFAEISFEEEIFDFGGVKEGEKLLHTFSLQNSGNENLLIKKVTSGCGCTVVKWTINEIPPGGKGEVEVIFDTTGKSGKQVKTVSLETNAVPSVRVIHVTAEIREN